jgi:hypothetical protein
MKQTSRLLVWAFMGTSVMAQSNPQPSTSRTAADVHRQEAADARELLKRDSLSPADIARVLKASHAATRGRVFRFTNIGQDDGFLEVEMGADVRPRYLHGKAGSLELFEDYTGTPARSCNGEPLPGTLVIDYAIVPDGLNPKDNAAVGDEEGFVSNGRDSRIQLRARVLNPSGELYPAEVFEIYANERPIRFGPTATIDGHIARAFISGPEPRPIDREGSQGQSYPRVAEDWFWIDVQSLVLVWWEPRFAGKPMIPGSILTEEPNTHLHPPTLPNGFALPTCVKWTEPR